MDVKVGDSFRVVVHRWRRGHPVEWCSDVTVIEVRKKWCTVMSRNTATSKTYYFARNLRFADLSPDKHGLVHAWGGDFRGPSWKAKRRSIWEQACREAEDRENNQQAKEIQ